MKSFIFALAILTAACAPTVAPSNPPVVTEPVPDERSYEPGVTPGGYFQYCKDNPHSQLCE